MNDNYTQTRSDGYDDTTSNARANLKDEAKDFAHDPTLAKFLDSIWIDARHRLQPLCPDGKCIFLEDRGGAYRHEWMVKAALDRIYAKLDDYEGRSLDRQHALGQLASLPLR